MKVELPGLLADLEMFLEEFGFVREKEQQGKGFGNQMVTLRAPAFTLRFVRDRDQWSVEVADPRLESDWYDIGLIEASLEGGDRDVLSIEDQAQVLREIWPKAAKIFEPQHAEATHRRLAKMRDMRARRRFPHLYKNHPK